MSALDLSAQVSAQAAVAALTSCIVFTETFTPKIARLLTKNIAQIIANSSEIVRRSSLSLFSLLSENPQFPALIENIVQCFPDWTPRAQEIILSFAFYFTGAVVKHWAPFRPLAQELVDSPDELLASTSGEFIWFLDSTEAEQMIESARDEPKTVIKLRSSLEFSTSARTNSTKQVFREEEEPISEDEIESSEEEEEDGDDDEEDGNEDQDDIGLETVDGETEEEDTKGSSYPLGFLDERVDWEHAEPPKSSEKMRNSINFRKTMETSGPRNAALVPAAPEPRVPRPVKTATHKFQPGVDWEVVKPVKREVKKPVETKRTAMAKRVVKKEHAAAERQKTPKRSLSELVPQMREKEWEKQQSAIEGIQEVLETNPAQVMSFCKEIWLNLIDLIASPRTMLANNALQFAGAVYSQFAQILAPMSAQFIVTLMNLCCSSHQFIADGAASVLCRIAEKSPRNRVFASFITGARHRNPMARHRSVQCLSILAEHGRFDDDEMGNLIKAVVPLVRDTKSECRESARKLLKGLCKDERFLPMAQRLVIKSEDFKEMRKLIE
jgi:hypothetical protein